MPEDSVASMHKDIQEIIPGLFLGPYDAVSKINVLLHFGITHVICISEKNETVKPNFSDKLIYLTIEMEDTMVQNIIPHIFKCKDFIDQCFSSRGKCVIYSLYGISRSPALVIGYVMGLKRLAFKDALDFVRQRRVCICPNDHFLQQLKEYEAIYRAEQIASRGQCSRKNGVFKRKFDHSENAKEPLLPTPQENIQLSESYQEGQSHLPQLSHQHVSNRTWLARQ